MELSISARDKPTCTETLTRSDLKIHPGSGLRCGETPRRVPQVPETALEFENITGPRTPNSQCRVSRSCASKGCWSRVIHAAKALPVFNTSHRLPAWHPTRRLESLRHKVDQQRRRLPIFKHRLAILHAARALRGSVTCTLLRWKHIAPWSCVAPQAGESLAAALVQAAGSPRSCRNT